MPTRPHSPAAHHYIQAELTLASLGSVAETPEEATREAAVALVHAVLSIAASLAHPTPGDPRSVSEQFWQDY